jgi:glycosyltransferase involved in cell wall biosynthesis
MRILQVYMGPYVEDKGGGVSAYVRNISERLAKKHDVTVFASWHPGLPRFEVVKGVKVERFVRYAPGGAYSFTLEMPLRLRKVEFDVVHGHCYHALPMHFSVLAKRRKLVLSTHFHGVGHSAFRNSLIKFLKPFGKKTLKEADWIVAVSEYEKNLLIRHFKLNPEKIVVIPAGVDLEEFKGVKRRERGFRSLLYVGRLVEYKGMQYLIEVLPYLTKDVVLEIVGSGPLKTYLENRAKELGVFERVKFYHNLPRCELLQLFVDADVFVLPSKYEAYSLVVAEALTAGVPCIVANTSALKEWIDGETCFGINYPVRLEDLARVISTVLNLGIYGKIVSQKWLGKKILNWDDVVSRLEYLYAD